MAMMATETYELEVKPSLVRKNYEFGFRPLAFEMLAGCPHGHVQLAAGKTSLMVKQVREQNLKKLPLFLESGRERGIRERDRKRGVPCGRDCWNMD